MLRPPRPAAALQPLWLQTVFALPRGIEDGARVPPPPPPASSATTLPPGPSAAGYYGGRGVYEPLKAAFDEAYNGNRAVSRR